MAGRPPLPKAVRELQGNPGRRPLNEDEPSTPPLSITPPESIENDPIASEVWHAVGNMTKAMNVAQESDRLALEMLSLCLAEVRRAYESMNEEGRTVFGPGGLKASPHFGIMNKMMERAMSIMKEFGMTPAARTKVKAMAAPNKKSKLAQFLEGGDD